MLTVFKISSKGIIFRPYYPGNPIKNVFKSKYLSLPWHSIKELIPIKSQFIKINNTMYKSKNELIIITNNGRHYYTILNNFKHNVSVMEEYISKKSIKINKSLIDPFKSRGYFSIKTIYTDKYLKLIDKVKRDYPY